MARGWHYAKLSLSNAPRLSFPGMCILLFLFLSLCRFLFVFFFCSHWSLVDVPLIFFCPADHVPDWQPRILLGMVEARSVNVKKTTTIPSRVTIYNMLRLPVPYVRTYYYTWFKEKSGLVEDRKRLKKEHLRHGGSVGNLVLTFRRVGK